MRPPPHLLLIYGKQVIICKTFFCIGEEGATDTTISTTTITTSTTTAAATSSTNTNAASSTSTSTAASFTSTTTAASFTSTTTAASNSNTGPTLVSNSGGWEESNRMDKATTMPAGNVPTDSTQW